MWMIDGLINLLRSIKSYLLDEVEYVIVDYVAHVTGTRNSCATCVDVQSRPGVTGEKSK